MKAFVAPEPLATSITFSYPAARRATLTCIGWAKLANKDTLLLKFSIQPIKQLRVIPVRKVAASSPPIPHIFDVLSIDRSHASEVQPIDRVIDIVCAMDHLLREIAASSLLSCQFAANALVSVTMRAAIDDLTVTAT